MRRTASLLCLLASLVVTAQAQTSRIVSPREEDLRLLEVVVDESVLTDSLAAYQRGASGILLPLSQLSELLGVAITVHPGEGLAEGFILSEHRTFHLDVERHEVTIQGRVKKLDRALVQLFEDDIYVDSELLGQWLPINFDVDLFALRMRVLPREKLPMQLRLERERKIRHSRLLLIPSDPGYPRRSDPYQLFSGPFLDQTLRLSFGAGEQSSSYSTYATADLLFMEAAGYLSGTNEDPFEEARFNLGRRDPHRSLLGFLRAREYAFGDIFFPTSSLLSITRDPAPGFLLSNFPLNRPSEFDRHTFRGNLPPGWDVELYHNNALIDYQQSRADGQYSFENVPLLFGMNFFRLVFYGPQGQRRIEDHRFNLGESLTRPGEFHYRLVASGESEEEARGLAQLNFGLHRRLSAAFEVASLPALDLRRNYAKAGLRAFADALFGYADYVRTDDEHEARELGFQTRLLGLNIAGSHIQLTPGFVSEVFQPSNDPLIRRERLRLDTAIPPKILPRLPITVEVDRDEHESGRIRTLVRNRVSSSYKGLSLTNLLTWELETDRDERLEGIFQLSKHIGRLGVRGELLYLLGEMSELSGVNVTVERPFGRGYRFVSSITRSLLSDQHLYSVGFYKDVGAFAAGAHAVYRPSGDVTTNLDLSMGVGLEPREMEWRPDARAKASQGAASIRVFLDRNQNGILDPGEETLERVGFRVNAGGRPERTDGRGMVYLPELPAHQPVDLALDTQTLEDPQWLPGVEGIRFVPRPGRAAVIDFPIIMTGEIDGTVHVRRRGKVQDAPWVDLQLLNPAGKVVQQTKTAYDGFYVFNSVRPGQYQVRIAPPGRGEFELASLQGRQVTISADGSIVSGVDFIIDLPGEPVIVAQTLEPPTVAASLAPAAPAVATPAPSPQATAAASVYVVQLGAYQIQQNAEQIKRRAEALAPVRIRRRGELHIVEAGPVGSRTEASRLQARLRRAGMETFVRPWSQQSTEPDSPTSGSSPVSVPPAIAAAPPSRIRPAPQLPPRLERKAVIEPVPVVPQQTYSLQLGIFNIGAAADQLRARIATIVQPVGVIQSGSLFLVRVGPFASKAEAVRARERLRAAGISAMLVPRD